jgi:hypothetical protein
MFKGAGALTKSLLAVASVGLFFATLAASVADAAVGRVIGNIDGISQDGDHFFISGWTCQQGQAKSLAVHVYAEDPKNRAKRALIVVQFANLYSEPGIAQACRDPGNGKHRFVIMLPHGYGPQSTLYVNGIRIVDGVANESITGSGKPLTRLALLDAPHPPLPHLSGTYHKLAEHPRVFVTTADLKDLVARINRPGSYSMQRFGLLLDQIKHDLASGIDWDVTYSGCNGWIYNYVFSYEPQDHHEAEIRAELTIAQNAKAPAGGAVVAARLALYAALVKAGAVLPAGAPSADDATALAKRILLAWANHGLPRDAQGRVLPLASKSCGPTARAPTMTQPRDTGGLALGRGVLYSVHAQDLLQSFGALDASEEVKLNDFHDGLFELLRQAANGGFGSMVFPYPDAARYGNITANMLASLLATARLLDDEHKINAVLYGDDRTMPVLPSFIRSFDRLIYGQGDSLPETGENRFPDSLTSLQNHADYQNRSVAAGEIADRGRNANPLQGIGYPMFTLERLFDAAEILRTAGFDPYGYRGAHRQSIEMALQYYACYAQGAGFYKVVTRENSRACPDAEQNYGKLVNGVDRMVLIGADRFPSNASITALEASARLPASSGGFATDAVLFGKWRD